MRKVKDNTDTSLVSLTIHRDYSMFFPTIEKREQFTYTYILPKDRKVKEADIVENTEMETITIEGWRQLDGNDLGILHYVLTAFKHSTKKDDQASNKKVRISLSALCNEKGVDYNKINADVIHKSLNAMMKTIVTVRSFEAGKLLKMLNRVNGDKNKLRKSINKVTKYRRMPIIKSVDSDGEDTVIVEIDEIYIKSVLLSYLKN